MAAYNPLANAPKQALDLISGDGKVTVYEETGGRVTSDFAAHNVTLLSPIPSGSIIHDNACGSGTVSRHILAASPAVKIYATDVDKDFLAVLESDVQKNSWPIVVSNQKSEALSFPDDYFTHSIMNFAVFFTSAMGLDGAKEIYRTLQPGGTAVVNCWASLAWHHPSELVHEETRPDKPFPKFAAFWFDGQQLQKVMAGAGFKKENTRVEKTEAWAKTTDLTTWAKKTWAFLGGLGGWQAGDGDKWDEAVDLLVKYILASPDTKKVGDEVWMKATQWVVIATK